jgi:hypothetical protein
MAKEAERCFAITWATAMVDGVRGYDVVVDFWDWYRRREARLNPLATYALDKCEETFRKCEWSGFGYWYQIYLRERPKAPRFPASPPSDQH